MKQKLFTLLTLALFFCSGAWADETIFLWQFAGGSSDTYTTDGANMSASTGTATFYKLGTNNTSTEKTVAYNAAVTDADLKPSITYDLKIGNNDVFIKIALASGTFQTGDVIYLCGYATALVGAPTQATPTQSEIRNGDTSTEVAMGTSKGDCNVGSFTLTSAFNGVSALYIGRKQGSSCGLVAIKVVRPGAPTQVATPTFTPNGATFTTSQSVTLACATDDSSIYYTTDGTTPSKTNGTLYSSAINLTSSTTIKAIAVDDNETLEDSEVATATFTKVIATPWNSWDFTNWSSATQAGVRADETNWDDHEESGNKDLDDKCYSNKAANSTFVYGSPATTIPETKGLTFATTAYRFGLAFDLSSTTIATGGYHGSQYLWLYGSNSVITIPSVPAGATIEIGVESHKLDGTADATRTLNVTNTDKGSVLTDAYTEETFTVSTTGNVTIYPSKGMHIYYITITAHVATVPITTASGKNYATYVTTSDLDFSSVSDDIKAYVAASTASAGSITFTGKDEVPAGTPLLIKTTSAGATVNVPVAASTPAAVGTNYLVAGNGGNVTYDASASHFYYILTNGEFKQANNSPVAVGKAYLALPSAATSNELTINFDDEAGDVTGIATVSSKKQNNGEYYNLNGQRVDANHKGIVIVNGKKFFNK